MVLDGLKGRIEHQYLLKNLTTWRVGGPAEHVYWPETVQDFIEAIQRVRKEKCPLWVLGKGSNVLAPDEGLPGWVIVTTELKKIVWGDYTVKVEAGYSLARLSQEAGERGWSGLEFARGIPGTLGGALIMNAGAHGGEISERVNWVRVMDHNGQVKVLKREDIEFGYRKSSLQNLIVLEAELVFRKGVKEEILAKMAEYLEHRKRVQPLDKPNAGSVFRNPPDRSAGYLIEKAGWKGQKQGGARVSEKHANFIVNEGNASAHDIYTLITKIQADVLEKFNVKLETEVLCLNIQ